MAPEVSYARSGDLHIAYRVVGDGPMDLLWIPTWISEVEHVWDQPWTSRMLRELTSFSRLITFDRRGTGLSDPVLSAPTLEEQMDDVVAVLDAVGSEQAALVAMLEAGSMAALFAATHPERTRALVMYASAPRFTKAPGYEFPLTKEQRDEFITSDFKSEWGSGARVLQLSAPGDESLRRWAGRLERLSASPGMAPVFMRALNDVDVRPVLPSIQAPTLVLHRPKDQQIDIRHSQYMAEHIPGARLVELPGDHTLPFGPGQEEILAAIEEFLTGARRTVESERVLATVMFGDIVESTKLAAEMGDRNWRELLRSVASLVGRELRNFRGRPVKTLGDGFLATFDGPARAIRCAIAIRDQVSDQLNIRIRAGLHTGEIELMGNDVGGIAVHIAARVIGKAGPEEALVSNTVKDLVVGSGIEFEDRGEHELRGVPDRWHLWAVVAG